MTQGTPEDNARDELNEVTGGGRREREVRKEATPRKGGCLAPGVKDYVQVEWSEFFR